jgi:hypothetical protein
VTVYNLYSQARSAPNWRGIFSPAQARFCGNAAAMLCVLQQSATTSGETRPGKMVFEL